MIHYHGTPITPRTELYKLAGLNFCISYMDPRDLEICHEIGQSIMLDNGAYTAWKRNRIGDIYPWGGYYEWVRPWLDYHTTWCVIPDVINGTEAQNDALIHEWCSKIGILGMSAAPVWHLHESIDRLKYLIAGWPRICFGSSMEFSRIGGPNWNNRMNQVFNEICYGSGKPQAWIHMLRGMSLAGSDYPFASVDSTDVAQNKWIKNNALERALKWDAIQCPARWIPKEIQNPLNLMLPSDMDEDEPVEGYIE